MKQLYRWHRGRSRAMVHGPSRTAPCRMAKAALEIEPRRHAQRELQRRGLQPLPQRWLRSCVILEVIGPARSARPLRRVLPSAPCGPRRTYSRAGIQGANRNVQRRRALRALPAAAGPRQCATVKSQHYASPVSHSHQDVFISGSKIGKTCEGPRHHNCGDAAAMPRIS